jgi:hypothetical protein
MNMNNPSPSASAEPPAFSLPAMIETANTQLEERVQVATHQAFNLGCAIGLLPAAVFGIAIFLTAGFSVIGAAMALILGIISAIAFANLAAMVTRRNTLRRTYEETINPDIEKSLRDAGISREEFDRAANDTLSPSAPLLVFVRSPENSSNDLLAGELDNSE